MKNYVYCAVNKNHEIVEMSGSSSKTTYFKTDRYLNKSVELHNKYNENNPLHVVKFQLVPDCMVLFSARKWIEEEFEKWCEENEILNCPNALVAFMGMNDWLKSEDIMNDWREHKDV